MLGWKGSAALKKSASAISLERPVATQAIFENFHRHQAVDRGLAGQKSSLPPVAVMSWIAQQPHTRHAPHQRPHSCIGKIGVVAHRLWVSREMQADVRIGHKQSCRDSRQRYQPFGVGKSQTKGAGPDLLLVIQKISAQSSQVLRSRGLGIVLARARAISASATIVFSILRLGILRLAALTIGF